VARALAGPQFAEHLLATEHRQHQVENNQVRQQRLGLAQALLTVVSNDGFVALTLQGVDQWLGQAPLVLHDQNAGTSHDGRSGDGTHSSSQSLPPTATGRWRTISPSTR